MQKIIKSFVSISTIFMMVFSPFVALTPTVSAADTGFYSPTSTHSPNEWSSATNAFSSNDQYATESSENDKQGYSNFGFPVVPVSSTINGIEVTAEAKSSDTTGCRIEVTLSWNNGSNYTGMKTAAMSGSDFVYTLGSNSDTWNRTWLAGEFTNANFVARVSVSYDDVSGSSCDNSTVSLDHLQAKVYYTEPVQPAVNPELGQSCGLDVALVLDSSGSISSTELTQMKDAFKGFVGTLSVTPTQFSVTDFDTTATVLQGFTSNVSLINTAIDTPISLGSTNWEDGLIKSQSTFDPRTSVPNLIIFSSDGNPNKYNPNQGPGNGFSQAALNAAITQANLIKNSDTRIITLGIGSDVVPANLQAISSADAYYSVANFGELATALQGLATQLCGGTITAKKIIDADGDLQTTEDQTPGIGWSFDVAGSSQTTDDQGYTQAVPVLNGTYSVSETLQGGYSLVDASCSGATNNGTLSGTTISGIQVSTDNIVSCVFYNSPQCTPTTEVCDGVDNDCDGNIDEDISAEPTSCGVGACASTGELICSRGSLTDTCVEGAPSAETCDNLDNDCDGNIDGFTQPTTCGVGVCSGNIGVETCTAGSWGGDTCDSDFGATDEICDAGQLDEDCDGANNEDCECIIDQTPQQCGPQTDEGECVFGTQTCIGGLWGECSGATYPASEICDGLDNDCDGETDEGVLLTFYEDADGDTYGNGQMPTQACSAPTGYVSDSTDCNDADANINPGATEICDQIDNDCDGNIDEGDVCPRFVTINAYKIVCQAEADLPNWGDGGSDITSATASYYVAQHPNCQLVSDWYFEWAYAGTSNPGDNIIGPAGSGWNTFGPTDSNGLAVTDIGSLSGDRIWVREVMQEGYIPFSGDTTTPYDDVSAEIYCHEDVLNYDNYDYIVSPQFDNTYYCVGFNVPPVQTECTPQETQSCEASGSGICSAGTQTCDQSGFWGECVRTNEPVQEICDNQLDDDCDGVVNNGCLQPPVCGDSQCNGNETCETCPGDCGVCPGPGPFCGDGQCNGTENCSTCHSDCGGCPGPGLFCGDSYCSGAETCSMCPSDCGACPGPGPFCGDGIVNAGEQCDVTAGVSEGYTCNASCVLEEEGEVLGEETVATCGIYLYDYIKYGASNNSEEVKKLQMFLNNYMSSNLAVTGVYDLATMQAVNAFQVQCKEEVLKPWVDVGAHCDVNEPTGYVYITTQRWINLIMCPTLNLPMPDLSEYDKVNCTASGGEVLGEETTAEESNQQQFTTPPTETPGGTEQTASVANALTDNAMPWWLILIIILAAAALLWFIYERMKKR